MPAIPPADRTLVQLWWTDATNVAGGWHDADDLADFATDGAWECSNAGWLVWEDDRCYVLAGRLTDDGKNAGLIERIPKAAVTRKAVLAGPAAVPEQYGFMKDVRAAEVHAFGDGGLVAWHLFHEPTGIAVEYPELGEAVWRLGAELCRRGHITAGDVQAAYGLGPNAPGSLADKAAQRGG